MLTSAQQRYVKAIQARITHLETVMDVDVPSKFALSLKNYTTKCTFNIDKSSQAAKGKFCKLLGTGTIDMKAWLSTVNKERKILSVVMVKEMVFQEITFAQPCTLCVGQAELTVLNQETNVKNVTVIAVKFRKLLNKTELNRLTEHEAENAIKTWKTEEIEDLFPKLYFVGQIVTKNATWECIGTELMDQIPRDPVTKKTPFLYYQGAYEALKRLHAQGYAHGDAHLGNFMVVPKDSQHPVYHPSRVIMIDQDSFRVLPTAKDDFALRNLMIVQDLVTLFLWHNDYMTFYAQKTEDTIEIMNYICQKNPSHLICLPFEYFTASRVPMNRLRKLLKSTEPLYKQYNELMYSIPLKEIYQSFDRYFASVDYSQMAEKTFDQWYNEM